MEIFPLLRQFITYLVQACFVSKIFLQTVEGTKQLKTEQTVETLQKCSCTARKQWETVQTVEIAAEGTKKHRATLVGPTKKQPNQEWLQAPLIVIGAEAADQEIPLTDTKGRRTDGRT